MEHYMLKIFVVNFSQNQFYVGHKDRHALLNYNLLAGKV